MTKRKGTPPRKMGTHPGRSRLSSPPPLVVGVDVGGSHVAAALMNKDGEVLSSSQSSLNVHQDQREILREIAEIVANVMGKDRKWAQGIGVGLPGNLDLRRGVCRFSPNFPGWKNVSITTPLKEALRLPVFLLNDVRSATLGEQYLGAGKGMKNFVMMALGTGIGGGVVVNGVLLHGKEEGAGEVGHMTVDPDGPRCNCGNRGCLEAIASGPAIARKAVEEIKRGRESLLSGRVSSLEEVTAKIVARAARQGDKLSIECFVIAGKALGIAASSIVALLNPECFIIGGRVARAGKLLLGPMRREMHERIRMVPSHGTPVLLAALGPEAGMLGAGMYALLNIHQTGLPCAIPSRARESSR